MLFWGRCEKEKFRRLSLRCPEELLKQKKNQESLVNNFGGFFFLFLAGVRVMIKMVLKGRKTWGKGCK